MISFYINWYICKGHNETQFEQTCACMSFSNYCMKKQFYKGTASNPECTKPCHIAQKAKWLKLHEIKISILFVTPISAWQNKASIIQ